MADHALDIQAETEVIRGSGLFDAAWYLAQLDRNVSVAAAAEDFCRRGWADGVPPNPYFHPRFYLQQNPDIAGAGLNPLLHYITHGDAEGRDPSPLFFTGWYRTENALGPEENCLAHFLPRRFTGQVNPVPLFDAAWYLEQNPDVAAGGADPFEHFMLFGAAERRPPSADFDVGFYMSRYAAAVGDGNPLLHYLAHRGSGAYQPAQPAHEKLFPLAVHAATRPSPHFEERRKLPPGAVPRAKLLAFYLPQFHSIPENDAWWGQGFTDWTNLARAIPRFAGHLQPRIPRDLGYYSLDDPRILQKQIEMAQDAGLFGFIFYFYWFNGKRLLDRPLAQLTANPALDFPFCVMWANENWTRSWDGQARDVLIAQTYRAEDDAALVDCFAALFTDARYIRLQGRPVLMIYRAALIPEAVTRLQHWRELFASRHGQAPLIIMAQSLEDTDPLPYGLDGAIEFPPHQLGEQATPINHRLDILDPAFAAAVYDYADIAAVSLKTPAPAYPLIKTLAPGWDNDPRREGKGLVLHGATPALYQAWLSKLVGYAQTNRFFGEALIAVNAWNEWAEGAMLEPDVHFGAAFLNATARALTGGLTPANVILLVGHDAYPHGAQLLLLHIARHLARVCGFAVHVLLLGVGPLVPVYAECASVQIVREKAAVARHVAAYRALGIEAALVNSAASAWMVAPLAAADIRTTLLIHEMPMLLAEHNLQVQARAGIMAAATTIFASEPARRLCLEYLQVTADTLILPQGNYQEVAYDPAQRAAIRAALGIPATSYMVLGAGFADLRKGFDLFLQMAAKLLRQRDDLHFTWTGDVQPQVKSYLAAELRAVQQTGRFHLIPFTGNMAGYVSAADVYALTSREDPYPTSALEALSTGLPVIAFAGSGGIPELIEALQAGAVAQPGDVEDFAALLQTRLDHEALAAQRPGLAGLAAERFAFAPYATALLAAAAPDLPRVSVCVLNYNYARYLPRRLHAIFAQSHPVVEILFLDDASSDGSPAIAESLAAAAGRELGLIVNPRNAGAVFTQWRRAATAAVGDYIWLAEADDSAAPAFLAELLRLMAAAPNAVFGVAGAAVIDEVGTLISPSYDGYFNESGAPELAATAIFTGADFARRYLSERNLILNVSGVLWRRAALLAALDRCGPTLSEWQLAGDWRLYLEALTAPGADIAWLAQPLNIHRRHAGGLTQALPPQRHLDEIERLQNLAADRLGLDAGARARQLAYRQLIAAQFNAPPE